MQDLKDEKIWRDKLTSEEYRVLREKGTEPPFSGKLLHEKREGVFCCAACGNKLFSSDTKFDSGTGWPSFTDPVNRKNVILREDTSLGMRRTEVMCARCGSHLGHVFDDGPRAMPDGRPAGGSRYCINSCSLSFEENQ
jgi:peptide-methionine (R)-S-oxide reductase